MVSLFLFSGFISVYTCFTVNRYPAHRWTSRVQRYSTYNNGQYGKNNQDARLSTSRVNQHGGREDNNNGYRPTEELVYDLYKLVRNLHEVTFNSNRNGSSGNMNDKEGNKWMYVSVDPKGRVRWYDMIRPLLRGAMPSRTSEAIRNGRKISMPSFPSKEAQGRLLEYIIRSNDFLSQLSIKIDQFSKQVASRRRWLLRQLMSMGSSRSAYIYLRIGLRTVHEDMLSRVSQLQAWLKGAEQSHRSLWRLLYDNVNVSSNTNGTMSNNSTNAFNDNLWINPFSNLPNITYGSRYYFPEIPPRSGA